MSFAKPFRFSFLRLPPFGVVSAALRLPPFGVVSAALRLPPFGVVSAVFSFLFLFEKIIMFQQIHKCSVFHEFLKTASLCVPAAPTPRGGERCVFRFLFLNKMIMFQQIHKCSVFHEFLKTASLCVPASPTPPGGERCLRLPSFGMVSAVFSFQVFLKHLFVLSQREILNWILFLCFSAAPAHLPSRRARPVEARTLATHRIPPVGPSTHPAPSHPWGLVWASCTFIRPRPSPGRQHLGTCDPPSASRPSLAAVPPLCILPP